MPFDLQSWRFCFGSRRSSGRRRQCGTTQAPAIERLEERQLLTSPLAAVSEVAMPSAGSAEVLDAPHSLSPAGKSIPFVTGSLFNWDSVDGAHHYDIWVNDRTTGQSGVIRDQNVPVRRVPHDGLGVVIFARESYKSGVALVDGHSYIWTVRAIAADGTAGAWAEHEIFSVHQVTLPLPASMSTTTPVSPVEDTTTIDPQPTFSWTRALGAASYEIEVWRKELGLGGFFDPVELPTLFPVTSFPLRETNGAGGISSSNVSGKYAMGHFDPTRNVPVISADGIIGTDFTPDAPLPVQGKYYWRVRSVLASGEAGPWSETATFILRDAPGPIGPESPSIDATPAFRWLEVPGTDYYELQVDDLTTGESTIVFETGILGDALTLATPLPRDHEYSWKVRSVGMDGVTRRWSKSVRFVVDTALKPIAESEFYAGAHQRLRWTGVEGADQYDVWINDLTTGESGVYRNRNVDGTELRLEGVFPAGHIYIWTVRGVADDGTTGDWAAHQLFQPVNVVSIRPQASKTIDLTPTFEWTQAATKYYDLWVNDVTTGESGIIRETRLTTTSYTPSTPLPDGHTFIWTVRAVDERTVGAETTYTPGPWAEHVTFRTDTSLRPKLYEGYALGGPVRSTTPTFHWSAVAGAARYDLWINDLTTGEIGVVRQTDIAGTTYTPPSGLIAHHHYIWTVRGISDDGVASEWGIHERFRVAG